MAWSMVKWVVRGLKVAAKNEKVRRVAGELALAVALAWGGKHMLPGPDHHDGERHGG